MATFSIHSCEINSTETRTAQGIAEVMLDYLPWPTLDARIVWTPTKGEYLVTDNQTDFLYIVTLV